MTAGNRRGLAYFSSPSAGAHRSFGNVRVRAMSRRLTGAGALVDQTHGPGQNGRATVPAGLQSDQALIINTPRRGEHPSRRYFHGEVAEWTKALDWSSSRRLYRLVGSNPTLSATTPRAIIAQAIVIATALSDFLTARLPAYVPFYVPFCRRWAGHENPGFGSLSGSCSARSWRLVFHGRPVAHEVRPVDVGSVERGGRAYRMPQVSIT